MVPVESARPIEVAAIALVVFVLVMTLARLFARTFSLARRFVGRYVPERISRAIALVVAAALFLTVADGVIFRAFMRISDNSFAALDALIEPQYDAPADPMVTGSPQSLVSWEELGRAGRQFIASGPTAEDIAAFTGRPAKRPLRVYVGLNSADDIDDRAKLLLDEMVRTGAFDRKLLVVATPTGTGWMDPAAMDTLEYLHDGDTAIVGMQYSYLTSWISLLVEPGYGSDAARAMFRTVYAYWTDAAEGRPPAALPPGPEPRRPRLEPVLPARGGDRRSLQRRGVERPALHHPALARRDPPPQPGDARVAADLRRRLDHPLHQPGEPPRHPRGGVGADAARLPPVRERPDHLLHARTRCGGSPTG